MTSKFINSKFHLFAAIPVISEPPQNESAHVGQNVVFSAGISNFYGGSAAQAHAQWRAEDDRHLNPDDLYVNGTASGFVRLTQTLRNAKLSDSMTYIFVLSSPHWPTLMRSFELTVEPGMSYKSSFITNLYF